MVIFPCYLNQIYIYFSLFHDEWVHHEIRPIASWLLCRSIYPWNWWLCSWRIHFVMKITCSLGRDDQVAICAHLFIDLLNAWLLLIYVFKCHKYNGTLLLHSHARKVEFITPRSNFSCWKHAHPVNKNRREREREYLRCVGFGCEHFYTYFTAILFHLPVLSSTSWITIIFFLIIIYLFFPFWFCVFSSVGWFDRRVLLMP